jgi:Glycosyltransferase family 87
MPNRDPAALSSPMTPGWPAAAVFTLLVAVSAEYVFRWWATNTLTGTGSQMLYQASTMSFNYIDFGAIRRGLGGTIVRLLGDDRIVATVIFYLASAACVAAASCRLIFGRRRLRHDDVAPTLLLLALFMRWSADVGRSDLAVAALLAAATLAILNQRPVLACCAVSVGLFIHETSFIFGLPLLLALLLNGSRWQTCSRGSLVGSASVLTAATALYLLMGRLPHADVATMVSTVRSTLPAHEHVDWAIYFAVGGMRGVAMSMCQNATDRTYVRHLLSGLLIVVLFIVCLGQWRSPRRSTALLASVPSFLFLAVVANDFTRWTVLASFNAWLFAVGSGDASAPVSESAIWLRRLGAAAAIPLLVPLTASVAYPIYVPAPMIDSFAQRHGLSWTPSVADAFQRCDPGWRTVLDDPAAR